MIPITQETGDYMTAEETIGTSDGGDFVCHAEISKVIEVLSAGHWNLMGDFLTISGFLEIEARIG